MKTLATVMILFTVFMIFIFKKAERTRYKQKSSEIGKNFVVRPLGVSSYSANTVTIEVMTEMGNKDSVTLNMCMNQVRDYLYEVKVEGIDSISFVRTRSRYRP